MQLTKELKEHYEKSKVLIDQRLNDFLLVAKDMYFYELCYCICTPQNKAEAAFEVQLKLQEADFYNKEFNPIDILKNAKHYVRFHNTKSKRLLEMRENFPKIMQVIESEISSIEKRNWLNANVKGIGMKESSHFLRNIGHRNLAILDRHILKHLVLCGVYDEIPNISSIKKYLDVEQQVLYFAEQININPDVLDLLIWSYESGEVLK